MSKRPWYKRYPADFIAATLSMSLEEKGAYSMVLDMLYDRGGPVPDDPQFIARVCGCSVRKWNILRAGLLEKGKLYVTADGRISNRRADQQMPAEEIEAEKLAENGAKSRRKSEINSAKPADKTPENKSVSNKNNDLPEEGLGGGREHTCAEPEARSHMPESSKLLKRAKSSGADAVRVGMAILAEVGADPTPWQMGSANFSTVAGWLTAGYTEAEVMAVVRRRKDALATARNPLAYAARFMGDEVEQVRAMAAAAPLSPDDLERSQWEARLKRWWGDGRRGGLWLGTWGPAPDEQGCYTPAAVVLSVTGQTIAQLRETRP